MIIKQGYLVVNEIDPLRNDLYGPSKESSLALFGSEGPNLFPNEDLAKTLSQTFDEINVYVARLKLGLAENISELENLTLPHILLVRNALGNLNEFSLIGPFVKGSLRTFDTCSYLTQNGLTPFRNSKETIQALKEAKRQSQCNVSVAHFDLRRIS